MSDVLPASYVLRDARTGAVILATEDAAQVGRRAAAVLASGYPPDRIELAVRTVNGRTVTLAGPRLQRLLKNIRTRAPWG